MRWTPKSGRDRPVEVIGALRLRSDWYAGTRGRVGGARGRVARRCILAHDLKPAVDHVHPTGELVVARLFREEVNRRRRVGGQRLIDTEVVEDHP